MSQAVFSPDLMACVVHLSATNTTRMERSQGHRAHALFLSLIHHVDPQLAAHLHAPAEIKPWTVAPMLQRQTALHHGAIYPLRVAFLQSDLYLPFARAFLEQPQREFVLGEGTFRLQAIQTTEQSSPWAGVTAWSELIAKALPAEQITLKFATPTAFTQATTTHGNKPVHLFPDPTSVFKSLIKRWNRFSPRPIPLEILDAVDIRPKSYQLQTEMIQLKSLQLGFVGTITYELRGQEMDRHVLTAVADAAKYLGVGYKTTQGMGLVRRI